MASPLGNDTEKSDPKKPQREPELGQLSVPNLGCGAGTVQRFHLRSLSERWRFSLKRVPLTWGLEHLQHSLFPQDLPPRALQGLSGRGGLGGGSTGPCMGWGPPDRPAANSLVASV